jgi:hypothetical protein
LPKWRKKLEIVVHFVAYQWQEAWFSGQMYDETITASLTAAIENLKCPPALKCFTTHWRIENSRLQVPRTNINTERAVKLMQELKTFSKDDKYLHLKFVATNDL